MGAGFMADDTNDLVVLTTTLTEFEGAVIVGALEEEGIQAVEDGGFISGFKAEAPGGVRVVVRQVDADRAREVLRQIRENEGRVDWSKVDVGEPE